MQQLDLFERESLFNTEDSQVKKCSCCKGLLPYSAFGKNRSKSLGLACTCKECLRESTDILKTLHLQHKIPDSHVCPICEKAAEDLYTGSKRSKQPFRLDHDKKTGAFRGFLCDSCNTGLGKFGDNVNTIKKAYEYLNEKDGTVGQANTVTPKD